MGFDYYISKVLTVEFKKQDTAPIIFTISREGHYFPTSICSDDSDVESDDSVTQEFYENLMKNYGKKMLFSDGEWRPKLSTETKKFYTLLLSQRKITDFSEISRIYKTIFVYERS